MSNPTNKIENQNNKNEDDNDMATKCVMDVLHFNETQRSVIEAIAGNLGESIPVFLATAIRDHIESLLDCPEACGAAFSERHLAIWKAASPDA